METPEHDAQLDDPVEEGEENELDPDELDAEEAESAGSPEAPIGP